MDPHERIRQEQAFHDRQANKRAAFFREHPGQLMVSEGVYLDHEPWIRPALATFGDLRGCHVLDFGCGHGMASVVLARRGASVTAFDLSGAYVAEARARAHANRVAINFVQANGEFLPFADKSFDHVWGNAVLHHLEVRRAGGELLRVLKPGGLAVFCEPWGGNPLLKWARRLLPYHGKNRTNDETPLTWKDLNHLRDFFPRLEMSGYQLFSMAERVVGRGLLTKALTWWDERLSTTLPWVQRWCRYVVLRLK